MNMSSPIKQESGYLRIVEAALAIAFRSFVILAVVIAFAPTLPAIARNLGVTRSPSFLTVDCASTGLHIKELADGLLSIDVGSLRLKELHSCIGEPFQSEVWLLEDGVRLQRHPFVDQFAESAGSFRHEGDRVYFRPSVEAARKPPARYSLSIPEYCPLDRQLRSLDLQGLADSTLGPLLLAALLTFGVLLKLRSRQLDALVAVDSLLPRSLLVLVVVLRLSLMLLPEWNSVCVQPDTNSYIENRATRAPLYPLFLDLLAPEDLVLLWENSSDPDHPLLTAVRAGKLCWLASIGFCVWMLSRLVPPWLLAGVLIWSGFREAQAPYYSQLQSLNYAMTEPLNSSLTFVTFGCLFAYVARPSWKSGTIVSASTALLMLCRPQNISMFTVFGVVALVEQQRWGWRFAIKRSATLAALACLFVPVQIAINSSNCSATGAPPLAGHGLAGFALQFACADDIPHIQDPKMREVLRRCVEVHGWRRTAAYDPLDRSMNVNLYEIGVPSLHSVYGSSVDDFTADLVLGTIAKTVIWHHPVAYASMILTNWRAYWRPSVHVPLLMAVFASLFMFVKSMDRRYLVALLLGVQPVLYSAIYCVLARPIGRYTSHFAFAECAAPPLFIAIALTQAWRLRGRELASANKSNW